MTSDPSSTAPDKLYDWGQTASREVSWYDPAPALGVAATMSGLDYLRAIHDGSVPPPPIAELMGMSTGSVDEGVVSFTIDPHPSHYNPIGVVHGGIMCTVLDTVAGCAVHSTLQAGWGYTSLDINVSYLKAITLQTGTITATGRVIKGGRRVAFATAEAVDASGTVLATATSTLLVMEPRG